jgi:hypothetical protein
MRKLHARALIILSCSSLLCLGPWAARRARSEPITIGIAVGLGTSLAVAIAYDQFTANYLAISLGYATPEPDADLVWKLGRGEWALATDADLGPPLSIGQASTEVGYIWDTLDPIAQSKGNYFNASRTYKNGALKDAETGGNPPAPGAQATEIKIDVSNLPLQDRVTIDMHTGKKGSYDSLMGGGARYEGGQWVRWDSRSETDPTMAAYLDGTLSPGPGSDIPPYEVPSLNVLFAADEASDAVDWFPYFLSAIQSTGTYVSGGRTYYEPFSFVVPLSTPVDADGEWYASAGAMAADVVPEPSALVILLSASPVALVTWALRRRRVRS